MATGLAMKLVLASGMPFAGETPAKNVLYLTGSGKLLTVPERAKALDAPLGTGVLKSNYLATLAAGLAALLACSRSTSNSSRMRSAIAP